MATAFTYGGKPGAYLHLVGPVLDDKSQVDVLVPYSGDFSFTTTQETFRPVQELFQFLNETVNKASQYVPVLGQVKEAESIIKSMFGVQFYNKWYYAQAWKGSKPISFSLTIPFHVGGLNIWDGYKEVVSPINSIVRATLPYGGAEIVTLSPMPNGIDVFSNYTKSVVNGLAKTIAGGNDEVLKKSQKGMWTVELGLLEPTKQELSDPFLVLKDLIILAASPSYSLQQLDSGGNPVKGSVTLSLESQTIPTSSLFDGVKTA